MSSGGLPFGRGRRTRALARVRGVRPIARGQSTVEFAVVLFGFLALLAALGVLWRSVQGGLLVSHALQSASHHLETVVPGVISDVFLY